MATLVTGAAGFIGFHVTRQLMARGDAVVGIDSLNDYYDPRLKSDRLAELERVNSGSFHFEKLDFADADALEHCLKRFEFERILHLGAQPGVRNSIENPRAYVSANLIGHFNLLELARSRRIPHLIYASSSSVYGGNASLPFRVEDRTDHPISLYAATKRADELMSETYSHLYRLPMTGLRFFTVYGPWGRPDMAMWTFTRKILAGEPIQVFNHGRMRRDFTYIDDIVAGIMRCVEQPPADDGLPKAGGSVAPHRLYNIGNSQSEELLEVVRLIEQACGRKAELELLPLQPGDPVDTLADVSAIRRDLGYRNQTRIEAGIPKFVDWYRSYHYADRS